MGSTFKNYLVKVDGSHLAQVQVPAKVMTQIKGGATDVFIQLEGVEKAVEYQIMGQDPSSFVNKKIPESRTIRGRTGALDSIIVPISRNCAIWKDLQASKVIYILLTN